MGFVRVWFVFAVAVFNKVAIAVLEKEEGLIPLNGLNCSGTNLPGVWVCLLD